MINTYFKWAYFLFGWYFNTKESKYRRLRENILKSRMNVSYDIYLSGAMCTSFLFTVAGIVSINLLLLFLGTPEILISLLNHPAIPSAFHQYQEYIIHIGLTIFSFILILYTMYHLCMIYPAFVAGGRGRNIDQMLPYAINYISSMSDAGVLPLDLYRSLADNDVYGEISTEAKYLVKNVEILGHDLVTATKNLARTTPSEKLEGFLHGSITVITSGGELKPYLNQKSEQFFIEKKQEQKEFLDILGLLGETYVAAFVAGPLFLIIVVAIMSLIGGGANIATLKIIIYSVIPVGNALFIILVHSMTPEV
ncbi:type II secretion system F family protein [Methanosalsum zhilinae]|uniref:type II secretion system F family protein n=1 Tax=Methanosalsum zhilinae TaxID=39669 RepID=UPI0006623CF7|nr:type II secretion system F family protein [Methanosalsum zhilinae]